MYHHLREINCHILLQPNDKVLRLTYIATALYVLRLSYGAVDGSSVTATTHVRLHTTGCFHLHLHGEEKDH